MSAPSYSLYEDQMLQLHYPQGGTPACRSFIKRSKHSIRRRALDLGLRFEGPRIAHNRGQVKAMKISPHAHPLVRKLLTHLNKEGWTQVRLIEMAGIHRESLRHWNYSNPSLVNFAAACNAAGLELVLKETGI